MGISIDDMRESLSNTPSVWSGGTGSYIPEAICFIVLSTGLGKSSKRPLAMNDSPRNSSNSPSARPDSASFVVDRFYRPSVQISCSAGKFRKSPFRVRQEDWAGLLMADAAPDLQSDYDRFLPNGGQSICGDRLDFDLAQSRRLRSQG